MFASDIFLHRYLKKTFNISNMLTVGSEDAAGLKRGHDISRRELVTGAQLGGVESVRPRVGVDEDLKNK